MSPSPAAITFDLHGTLVDDTSRWQEAIGGACAEIAELHPDLEASALVAANLSTWEEYYPNVESDWLLGKLDSEELRAESWRRTLAESGVNDEALVRSAQQIFFRHYNTSHRLFEDVNATLDELSRRVALAIVTNAGNESRVSTIERLGLDQRFEAIVVSAEIGFMKPDPRIFSAALNDLGLEAQMVWHVGDNPYVDVAGANDAGLTSVWLSRDIAARMSGHPRPDHTIASLSELTRLVE
jgi:putative hydrolase of the HAD superfamily